ncbi:MAG: hypothetical protein V2A73_01040, partial [Pseudomonadota bacterium]
LGTRNQELEQPPRYGSHLNRRPESRIKSIGWPPSIEQSPSTLRDTPGFSAGSVEANQANGMARASLTYNTLAELSRRSPDTSWRLVVGSDILAENAKWWRWEEITRMAPLIVVGRRGHPAPFEIEPTIELPDVSSSDVRARLTNRESVGGLLPRAVVEYLAAKGLYR